MSSDTTAGLRSCTTTTRACSNLDLIADMNPETNHAGCYIITTDADAWHSRLVAVGLQVTPIEDKPWGMHEFTLTGPSGSSIRIGRNTSND